MKHSKALLGIESLIRFVFLGWVRAVSAFSLSLSLFVAPLRTKKVAARNALRQRIASPDTLPRNQRVLVFSPHPDDDVISMGGMLQRLVKNENHVIIAYMTTGERGVSKEDLERHQTFLRILGREHLQESEVRIAIRWSEAISAISVFGLPAENIRMLKMPFYAEKENIPISAQDREIIHQVLQETDPHHIFVAADLEDPHDTHASCFEAIQQATASYERPLTVWLYRGAWQEWPLHKADVFLPLTYAELGRKISGIKRHKGQMHPAPFAGNDPRQFYERAEERNLQTGAVLSILSGTSVHAAEAFVVLDRKSFALLSTMKRKKQSEKKMVPLPVPIQ